MFEKVNPSHPDKIADRIAGAVVDLAYTKNDNPKIAVEVLIGHGTCTIIAETGEKISQTEVEAIVQRIAGSGIETRFTLVPQDEHLAANQENLIRCGDNGIFKGCPNTKEQRRLAALARDIYELYPSDGKYLIDDEDSKLVVCQSCNPDVSEEEFWEKITPIIDQWVFPNLLIINPLGQWTGGINSDCGATNRKLGSDMGDAVTGGGLHGKDLSKADITLNIYCHLKALELGKPYEISCAIGDDWVDGKPYSELVEIAREYIKKVGGFEKFAEWAFI